MEIKISTDWQLVNKDLQKEIRSIGFNPDFSRILNNISTMVSDLSKLEVEARRTKSTKKVNQKLKSINQAINRLESLTLIAKLMQ